VGGCYPAVKWGPGVNWENSLYPNMWVPGNNWGNKCQTAVYVHSGCGPGETLGVHTITLRMVQSYLWGTNPGFASTGF